MTIGDLFGSFELSERFLYVSSMKTLKDKIVWVTGASSGIGEALVYEAIAEGAIVIASARRVAELERVKTACGPAGDRVHIAPLDLTQMEAAPELAAHWVEELGRIDVLINNGGISQRGLAAETDLSVDRRIMEVNYFGQIALTKAVLPYMRRQQSGYLVAISSLTGKFGFPQRSAYAASKHALHGFFETVLLEEKPNSIGVTLVNPGRIKTQISYHALTQDGTTHGVMDAAQETGMPPEKCAQQILKAVKKQRPEITIGGKEVLMVYFKRFIPALFRRIASNVDPNA